MTRTITKKQLLKTLWLGLLLAVPFSAANATIILSTWDTPALNASGDYVEVNTGTYDFNNSWFSLQWMPGANNSLTALGIDTVFYNALTPIAEVWSGAINTGLNVTSQWTTNYGGVTGGGGFGDFLSQKSLDSGVLDGVANPVYFLLFGNPSFPTNANGASFDVHVVYTQGCSGWVSNGATNSRVTGSCDGATGVRAPLPEPPTLALFVAGLLGLIRVGPKRRWFRFRRSLDACGQIG